MMTLPISPLETPSLTDNRDPQKSKIDFICPVLSSASDEQVGQSHDESIKQGLGRIFTRVLGYKTSSKKRKHFERYRKVIEGLVVKGKTISKIA